MFIRKQFLKRTGLLFFVTVQIKCIWCENDYEDYEKTEIDPYEYYDSNYEAEYDNPELGEEYGGDMLVPEADSRRTFVSLERRRWTKGIVPYHLSSEFYKHPLQRTMLLNSMNLISNVTDNCIQFFHITQRDIETYPTLPYMQITGKAGKGCTSSVGKHDDENHLNLDIQRCFTMQGFSLHELLHTLGQIHEHMRPDRDDYVTILWDNIKKDKKKNFKKFSKHHSNYFHFPYDYDSITHYRSKSFSKEPKKLHTIVPKNSNVKIGQRTHLSHMDIEKLKLAYKCHERKHIHLNSIRDVVKYYNIEKKEDRLVDIIESLTEAIENASPLIHLRRSLDDKDVCKNTTEYIFKFWRKLKSV